MNNKGYQKKMLLVVLAIVVILIIGLIALLSQSSDKKNLYSNECYSLVLPENCTAQESEYSKCDVYIMSGNEKIAMITVAKHFEYGDSVERIVANWIGMRTSVKSDESFYTNKKDEFRKVIVATELSAADEIKGVEPYPDEVHYFYLSEEDLFIDIMVYDDAYISQLENAIKTFTVK